MSGADHAEIRQALEEKKQELTTRLERIHANLRRGYEADSKERAKSLTRWATRRATSYARYQQPCGDSNRATTVFAWSAACRSRKGVSRSTRTPTSA